MKIWSIIATVLMVFFIGLSVWLYSQNNNLKTQVSSTQTQIDQTNQQKAKALNKTELLSLFFNGQNDPDMVNKAEVIVQKINDATITADFTAFKTGGKNADPTQLFQDLLTTQTADLK